MGYVLENGGVGVVKGVDDRWGGVMLVSIYSARGQQCPNLLAIRLHVSQINNKFEVNRNSNFLASKYSKTSPNDHLVQEGSSLLREVLRGTSSTFLCLKRFIKHPHLNRDHFNVSP